MSADLRYGAFIEEALIRAEKSPCAPNTSFAATSTNNGVSGIAPEVDSPRYTLLEWGGLIRGLRGAHKSSYCPA